MRILINDIEEAKVNYVHIFEQFGYERNELILCHSFDESKSILVTYAAEKKLHLDLVITNTTTNSNPDTLQANELCFLKNNIDASFSKSNFRVSSIPIILYSSYETKSEDNLRGFSSIIKKNESGNHTYFISECERVIREWRRQIFIDLESLGIEASQLNGFHNSEYYRRYYQKQISVNAEYYFALKTRVLSLEFIKLPVQLNYDWILLDEGIIERTIAEFNHTYRNHVKYDRKNNERTILHDFFSHNRLILLRDTYTDLKYEKNLYDLNGKTSEECDFILKTEYPDFLNTTFFEIKKEDVVFYVRKNTKRPQLSSMFISHLEQVWRYKEYAQEMTNLPEIKEKVGYETNRFDFVLLAGRLDEKLEIKDKFESDITRMYQGIDVITYEELEDINISYLDRFSRLI